jgi:hypothetical protein
MVIITLIKNLKKILKTVFLCFAKKLTVMRVTAIMDFIVNYLLPLIPGNTCLVF